MSGFVALHRDAFSHALLKDPARFRAWFWLVAHAAWKPTPYDVSGKIVTLQRGEICASVRQLADTWGWSKSSVDRFLGRLKSESMIGTDSGTGKLIITICNYDKYQSSEGRAGTEGGSQNDAKKIDPNATRTQPDQKPGQQRDTSNPHNSYDFDEFDFPSRDSSGTAAGQQRDIKEQVNKLIIEDTNVSSDSARDARLLVDAWNAMAEPLSLSTCRAITPKRMPAFKARLKDTGMDALMAAIEKIPRSRFLRGDSGSWGGATIDFLLQPDSVTKIFEGKYDDRAKANYGNGNRDNRDGFTRILHEQAGIDGFG
ncbi:hypothetical protein GRI39_02055 [Altererythrobacter indicus]|uniref:Uncharacterized protein n=1 Tax=Altericroceibacterium indicum TaxID=374177 RepID=A0A845A3S0_9SPHN|nr:hypothetical protein [Altericroceibacterium indicum]MXP24830.1 hypothetical protein [Altericroceibacterium indicum]